MINLHAPLTIRNVTIPNRLFLAPVDSVFDPPFRRTLKRIGKVGVTYSEVINATGLFHRAKKAHRKSLRFPGEAPYAVQLSDYQPDVLADMAARLQDEKSCEFVDLNLGCPARRTVNSQSGASLLLHPDRIQAIVAAMRKVLEIPLTAKIRIGWDAERINGVEVAKILEGEGVDLVTVHGRTRTQAYGGISNWEYIGKVKQAVNIPVIANGDVVDWASAKKMLEVTGADGVMVARAAFGDPWALRRIYEMNDTIRPTPDEVLETMLDHLDFQLDFFADEEKSLPPFRKHLLWYVKGYPGARKYRKEVVWIDNRDELVDYLKNYFENLPEEANS